MLAKTRNENERQSPFERLNQHAFLLEGWLTRSARIPARWSDEQFARSVDLVRAHLRPIRSQYLLGLSYAREHFHVMAVGQPPLPPVLLSRNATEVAYAVRWLEIAREVSFGPWQSIIGQDNSAYLEAS